MESAAGRYEFPLWASAVRRRCVSRGRMATRPDLGTLPQSSAEIFPSTVVSHSAESEVDEQSTSRIFRQPPNDRNGVSAGRVCSPPAELAPRVANRIILDPLLLR